jgi:lysophospholipase L1-like esterase
MKDRLTAGAALSAIFVICLAGVACGGSPTGPTPNPPPTQPQPTENTPPPPPPPPPPLTLGLTRILAFGDSMTEGTTSTPVTTGLFALDAGLPRSYPFKLQALTTQRYSAQTIQVLNAGHAGNQAVNDIDRFGAVVGDARPDLVLLLEGANDLNQPFATGEGFNARVSKVVSALEEMVKNAVYRGIPVMIGTLPPQRAGAPRATDADLLVRFNSAVKTMAAKKGAQLVDVNTLLPLSEIGQDGLHPTEAGYQHLAEIWLDVIKAKYERAATP